ncbi:MAG TPA: rhomboid family intramembrane serine protease [Actinomycetaceae bacterium]|nr:rhomboid family intramembrane serine protease [Actinomycetaceae bacterium]
MAQARKAAPAQRTIFGGTVREGQPLMTMIFAGLCVVAYLVLVVVSDLRRDLVFLPVLGEVEPHRFLTAAFLHAGFLHLAINMYALWIVGSVLEPVLGRWRFTVLYLLSALGGSVGVLLLASPQSPAWITPVVGASGAVFGLFGGIAVVLRRMRRDTTQILVLLVINAVISLFIARISWQAHLGGLIVGALLTAAFVYAPKKYRTVTSVGASVVVFAMLVVASMVKYASV